MDIKSLALTDDDIVSFDYLKGSAIKAITDAQLAKALWGIVDWLYRSGMPSPLAPRNWHSDGRVYPHDMALPQVIAASIELRQFLEVAGVERLPRVTEPLEDAKDEQ